jgi:hypothetical protein
MTGLWLLISEKDDWVVIVDYFWLMEFEMDDRVVVDD